MKRSEVELLLKLLPRYYAHVERYPHTLLIKFFGLHRVKPATGGKVHSEARIGRQTGRCPPLPNGSAGVWTGVLGLIYVRNIRQGTCTGL